MSKDYLAFFHKLHCILRDGEIGLTGLNALNEINNMILIVFMEQYVNKYEINKEYKFSNIYNKYIIPYLKSNIRTEQNKKLDALIEVYNNLLMELHQNEHTKKYIFSDTNKASAFFSFANKGADQDFTTYFNTIRQLVELFVASKKFFYGDDNNEVLITEDDVKNVMNSINYDFLGDAYEKFKEDEVGNQGKTTAQYFTPRTVIKFIVEELIKPKYNEKCYDSSCGTGGFFHYLNKYVYNNFTKKQHEEFKNNMYGNDKTPEIIKSLYVNLFLHDIPVKNITNRNSVNNVNCWNQFERFDFIIGNPPYGMSIKSDPNKYDKYFGEKCYNYFPKFMHSTKDQTITDSMGQFMIHTINSLKVGGRFSLVIDRGILNNGTNGKSWQKSLRQWMLSVCDLDKIILLPKGIFTHTQFDTAVIYGVKKISYIESQVLPKPFTNNVNIYYGKFEDAKNRKGLVVDLNKPDLSLSIKDIINKDWSLNYDNYVEKTEDLYDGIQYKNIIQLCDINKSKRKAGDSNMNGKYKFFSSSPVIKYSDYDDFNGEYIILGNGGAGSCHYINGKFSCSADNFILNIKEKDQDKINIKYLYYYIKIQFNKLLELFTGQGLKHLTLTNLPKFKIPILPIDHQLEIVKKVDNIIGYDYELLDRMVNEFKDIDIFKFLLYKDYDTFSLIKQYSFELSSYEKYKKSIFEENKMKYTNLINLHLEQNNGNNKIDIELYVKTLTIIINEHNKYIENLEKNKLLVININNNNIKKREKIIIDNWIEQYNKHNETFKKELNKKLKKGEFYGFEELVFNDNKIKFKYMCYLFLLNTKEFINNYNNDTLNEYLDIKEIKYANNNYILYKNKLYKNINDFCINKHSGEIKINEQDEHSDYEEIEYKGKTLILDGVNLYKKVEDIEKGKIYGKYINNKVVKNKSNTINV
jgi:type I restriction-modification system DNA methylase subunit